GTQSRGSRQSRYLSSSDLSISRASGGSRSAFGPLRVISICALSSDGTGSGALVTLVGAAESDGLVKIDSQSQEIEGCSQLPATRSGTAKCSGGGNALRRTRWSNVCAGKVTVPLEVISISGPVRDRSPTVRTTPSLMP